MKIVISENQLKYIKESIELKNDNDNIPDDFISKNHSTWFDIPQGINPEYFKLMMNYTIKHLSLNYALKRVVIKDKGDIVGFLIYSETTMEKESFNGLNDTTSYPIILSVAIDPKYRKQKLFNRMLEGSGINKPFMVHTSDISPMSLWDSLGCSPFFTYPPPNQMNHTCLCK